ncbi:MAG: DUF4065 domain-containing protein [Oscillospiraceae bacterium]|nr:DUF4065 domain-containing protein [Oscillospiraceae bacterium]
MVSPLYVANNLIRRANEQGVELTNLKLQKLLYILYASYYNKTNNALFSNRFEAWQYGPVLSDVYNIFKTESSNQITEYRPDSNGDILVVTEIGDFGESFNLVWSNYARKSASYLINMTHGLVENPDKRIVAWKKAVEKAGYGTFMEDSDIKLDGEMWFA